MGSGVHQSSSLMLGAAFTCANFFPRSACFSWKSFLHLSPWAWPALSFSDPPLVDTTGGHPDFVLVLMPRAKSLPRCMLSRPHKSVEVHEANDRGALTFMMIYTAGGVHQEDSKGGAGQQLCQRRYSGRRSTRVKASMRAHAEALSEITCASDSRNGDTATLKAQANS